MGKLEYRIAKSIANKFPFAIYRMPNSVKIKSVFQKDSSTQYISDFSEKGFVFAPFNDIDNSLIIPYHISLRDEFDLEFNDFNFIPKSLTGESNEMKQIHVDLVRNGIDFIRKGEADKIVLSRKKVVSVEEFNFFEIFKKLMFQNTNAFVYLWFHPVSGLWMGASPEVFLTIKGNRFKTMALASTRSYEGSLDVDWNDKEKKEHQFVTDYIQSKLHDLDLKISKPFTIKAGSLVHICSNIEGKLSSNNQLYTLFRTLHPTPAVCGISKEKASQFILENENYDREFYTGFLGEVNQNSDTKLFVNLRCMKAVNNKAHIFVGGGITKDSDPNKEWKETVLKSEVINSVL